MKISLILRTCMYNLVVEIGEDFLFDLCVNIFVRIILVVWRNTLIERVFFSETVKRRGFLRTCAIEDALNRYDTTKSIVLHVVWKKHKLGDVYEPTEFFIGEPLLVHTLSFGNHTTDIIRLLNLNEDKRKTVNEKGNVGSKLIFISFAGELSRTMICIVGRMVIINKTDRWNSF